VLQRHVVGGAVRDRLLGLPVHDRDWVVVGATVEQMLALGFRPVGRDFPVFLHPTTHEEHALARTERKTGRGYRGFVVHADPGVSLEEDLARRDLTINAMAETADGQLIDPHGGLDDLRGGWLRHVSPAFAEDPVRILRVARFAARWPHFRVADETRALMQAMVRSGEVDALVPERIWQELARGLMERQPSRLLGVLHGCGAWPALAGGSAPDGRRLEQTARALDVAAAHDAPRSSRLLVLAIGLALMPSLAERWKLPTPERELLALAAREADAVEPMDRALRTPSEDLGGLAQHTVAWLDACDAWRRPERWLDLVAAVEAWHASEGSELVEATQASAMQALRGAHAQALGIDHRACAARAVAAGLQGPAIAAALLAARAQAVHTWLLSLGDQPCNWAKASAPWVFASGTSGP
jgi:tRNA nucleotidyltransferase (CCA-adding enzyme)